MDEGSSAPPIKERSVLHNSNSVFPSVDEMNIEARVPVSLETLDQTDKSRKTQQCTVHPIMIGPADIVDIRVVRPAFVVCASDKP